MYIYFLLILLIYYIINYNLQTKNKLNINNSFNRYGRKYIVPLLSNYEISKHVDKLIYKDLCKKYNIKTFKTLYILKEPSDLYNLYDNLPNSFVIKSNKGSGRNVIVKDKYIITPEEILKKLENYNHPYNPKTEPQYNYTIPKIYIEEYIDPIPPDIKILMFKNKPKILWIMEDRFNNLKRSIYKFKNNQLIHLPNCYWGHSSTSQKSELLDELIKKNKINYLIELTKKFKIDLPLVRYDFYWYKNDFYGSEITLTSEEFKAKISENCARYTVSEY